VGHICLNADDFGLSHEHNVAIIQAHRAGAIVSASLMVGQKGTDEAISLARETPTLPIGLHLALSDATPVLSPALIPSLVSDDGRFFPNESALLRAAFSIAGWRQLRSEIKAQFRAFDDSGIRYDHVNTHRHVHQLPHIAQMVLAEARQRDIKISRLPWDAHRSKGLSYPLRLLRFRVLEQMMKHSGITTIYHSIGRDWDSDTLLDLLEHPPNGPIELYFHPVVSEDHPYAGDLPALTDVRVLSMLAKRM
jgi:chitin disaccharide deacetylase